MSASLLELRDVTKRFGPTVALDKVSLSLERGKVLALVGENGAGKSTLMKILSGVHRPDGGAILLEGHEVHLRGPQDAQSRGISVIYQEFSLVPHLDVVENLFLGRERTNRWGACARREMQRQGQPVLDRLGADFKLGSRISDLSVAQQQLVEISKALLRQTRILIMDEPTATLTPREVGRLFSVMRELVQQGISIIFISHHLDEVFRIADEIGCLRDGRCFARRPVSGCSHGELIRMMVGRDLNQTFPDKPFVTKPAVVLDVQCLQRKPHLPAVSFQVHAGEILGIAGLVGSGRTKMIRALIGADRAHRRQICFRGAPLRIRNAADSRGAGIGLVPENRKEQGLVTGASVQRNLLITNLRKVCHPFWRFISGSAAVTATKKQIRDLRIKTASADQPVHDLSGGNQQKVVLGKWLHAGCQVLILDEPTRGIDVGAKAEIYQLMRELTSRGVAILMISSELQEVIHMSDRVMVMRNQRIEHLFAAGELVTEEKIISFAAGGCRG